MTTTEVLTTTNAGKDEEKLDLSYISVCDAKWLSTLDSSLAVSYKTKRTFTM